MPEHLQAAAGGAFEPRDGPPDGGLPRAGLPHQAVHLACADREIHAVDRTEDGLAETARVFDDEVLGDDHRWGLLDLLLLFLAQRGPGRAPSQVRHRSQQLLRVLLAGLGEQLLHPGPLDDPAAVHHGHGIGEIGDHAHVVGDDDQRGVEAVAHVAQQIEDLCLHGDVEGGGEPSATMSSAPSASAMAMSMMRCFCPPENSCG